MNKINNPRITYKNCPLCESDNIEKSIVGDCSKHHLYISDISSSIQWMYCKDCFHQFADGYFTENILRKIFSKTHDNQIVGFEIEKQRIVSARIIEKLLKYISKGVWLDIGFGNGSLLFTAQEYGFKTIGVDLRKKSVEAMQKLGFETYCEYIENIEFERKISIVSMMDVLEHIPYPKKILESVFSKMEKNAYLIISMPNTENIIWKLMTEQNKNPYLGEIEHYHNFSRTRLFSLLDECGFNIKSYGISERYRVCMEVIATKK